MSEREVTDWTTRAARREVHLPAEFVAGGGPLGSGRIKDLSTTGARIEETDLCPEVGSSLVVALSAIALATSVKVYAEVVRETETGGFCVHFQLGDSKQRMLRLMMLSHPFLTAGSKVSTTIN